jgi:hypothetical protein
MATFATLITELKARGFDYLSDARAGAFINAAYGELCDAADWPFLETTTSGAAPLTISDVRQVLYVIDTANKVKLRHREVESITEQDPDFSTAGAPNTTGTPVFWWLHDMSSIKVYPASTVTLAVRYRKFQAELTGTDTPIIPARFHTGIADVAAAMAAAHDESNDKDQSVVRAEVDRVISRMGRQLLVRNLDGPDFVDVRGGSTDW